jgi:hypothetical protein
MLQGKSFLGTSIGYCAVETQRSLFLGKING